MNGYDIYGLVVLCPCCRERKATGHAPDCELAVSIKALTEVLR